MQCGSNGGQRHVLTDKPLSASHFLNDDSAAARIGSDSGRGKSTVLHSAAMSRFWRSVRKAVGHRAGILCIQNGANGISNASVAVPSPSVDRMETVTLPETD